MNNLFDKIFDLKLKHSNNPLEDFLTEIFAACLRTEQFFYDFLQLIGKDYNGSFWEVKTQESFKALPNHNNVRSIPDIVIYLDGATIFIENKIGAKEGENQLRRYAEHLNQLEGDKTLIYITRDYDLKNGKEITKDLKQTKFKPYRWHQIYSLSSNTTSNNLIQEFKFFLKMKNLSSTNQFSPIDIITLTNFSRVKKMMDETIDGKVSEKFKEIFEKISKGSASMTQLKRHDRYIIYSPGRKNDTWLGLGYWLNSFSEKEYPELKFFIEVSPNSSEYTPIKEMFKKIENESDKWSGYNLDVERTWAGIAIVCNLKKHLDNRDNIKSIQIFFLKTLREYLKIEPIIKKLI